MITHCPFCQNLLYKSSWISGESKYFCENTSCAIPGIESRLHITISFMVSNNNEIIFLELPVVINNQVYYFITEQHKNKTYIYEPRFGNVDLKNSKMNIFYEEVVFEINQFTPLPLDFVPIVNSLVPRYLNLKVFS